VSKKILKPVDPGAYALTGEEFVSLREKVKQVLESTSTAKRASYWARSDPLRHSPTMREVMAGASILCGLGGFGAVLVGGVYAGKIGQYDGFGNLVTANYLIACFASGAGLLCIPVLLVVLYYRWLYSAPVDLPALIAEIREEKQRTVNEPRGAVAPSPAGLGEHEGAPPPPERDPRGPAGPGGPRGG
jgi:hypothetical protein